MPWTGGQDAAERDGAKLKSFEGRVKKGDAEGQNLLEVRAQPSHALPPASEIGGNTPPSPAGSESYGECRTVPHRERGPRSLLTQVWRGNDPFVDFPRGFTEGLQSACSPPTILHESPHLAFCHRLASPLLPDPHSTRHFRVW
jgi:hypothetical protein